MQNPSLFNTVLVWPIVNVLVVIYQGLLTLHIPYALGFAIIGLTVVIRLVLYPFTASQLKASRKMQKVAPHVAKLKEKHKNDAKMLQQETMRLYKEHGINPVAGCLPVLIQLPIIWGLYAVLREVVQLHGDAAVKVINTVLYSKSLYLHHIWDTGFFGVSLGKSPSQLLNSIGPVVLLFPILTGLFQLIQSKMMIVKPETVEDGKKEKKKEKTKEEDFATAFQSQSLYIFPLMIGFFSYSLQVGLSLYWITFTISGIIQQYRISGIGGLIEWKEKIAKLRN